jgi:hypothetical protein
MRTVVRLIELAAFLTLVWGAVAAVRYLGGEPWASIVRRPLGFLP